jgi:hypothetical protein
MNLRLLTPCLALLFLVPAARATESLVLNGSGIRTKPILGAMYDLALYVPDSLKGTDAKTIIEANQPMEFVLTIKSSLITRARFVEATTEGFAKAAATGYTSDRTPAFFSQFDNVEFRKGDVIVMRHTADGLSTLYRKSASGELPAIEKTLGTIPGLDFKKALFAIWLGGAPVQAALKQSLLGIP